MNDPMPAADEGLLLVGHGTRDQDGIQDFTTAAADVAAMWPGGRVQPCFLELAEPTIGQGIAALYSAGARRLTIAPLLLFEAGHAKRDIPEQVSAATAEYSDLEVTQYIAPLGCHPAILWLSELRYRQALAGRHSVEPADTWLVMIGRGSSDEDATAEMKRLAALRVGRTAVAGYEVGFLAVQRPTLDDALRSAADSSCQRIVVQPHLLFRGQLLEEVRKSAAKMAATRSDQEWIVTRPLGPGKPLVRAVLAQCGRHETVFAHLLHGAKIPTDVKFSKTV